MDCEYESDLIDEMIFGSSLPFACLIFCVWFLSFAMIIKLLM